MDILESDMKMKSAMQSSGVSDTNKVIDRLLDELKIMKEKISAQFNEKLE